MAKKQTRRSISVSRTTYERLKAFCETNHISMSQLVETRVNDFLGPSDFTGAIQIATGGAGATSAGAANVGTVVTPSMLRPVAPRPVASMPVAGAMGAAGTAIAGGGGTRPVESRPGAPSIAASIAPQDRPAQAASAGPPAPMTSAAARFAVDPPPPIIKPRQDTAAPKPAEKRPDQIFTF
jgi:hypothetical protein